MDVEVFLSVEVDDFKLGGWRADMIATSSLHRLLLEFHHKWSRN